MHSVFIVGGSGKVARSLARQLADRGHEPHSLYRHAEQAEGLEALGAIPWRVTCLTSTQRLWPS